MIQHTSFKIRWNLKLDIESIEQVLQKRITQNIIAKIKELTKLDMNNDDRCIDNETDDRYYPIPPIQGFNSSP